MHSFRTIRYSLLALCVAVFQLMLPIAAYAHMASTGNLMQEVCSASGSQSVASDVSSDDGGAGSAGQSIDHSHQCCMCSPPAFMAVDAYVSPSFSEPHCDAIKVGQTFFQHGSVVFQPPATGPPALV